MKIKNLSFITPMEMTADGKFILQKSYSQNYRLVDGSNLSLSSRIGNRKTQQDCIAISKNEDYLLMLVTDGIGGMKEGEVASYTTAKIIKQWIETEGKQMLKELNINKLEDALTALIYLISTSIPNFSGATLNMSIICPNKTLIVNIGDSRAYIIKDGNIKLVTEDDSIVFKRYKPHTSNERNKLRFHKDNNILTNSITKSAFPTIKIITIENDDYDILCHVTDGVSDILQEQNITSYCYKKTPATILTKKSTTGLPIYHKKGDEEYLKMIRPGSDNSTAIVYTRKKTK